MFDTTPVYAPFDLDHDEDNPYAAIPERFVAESDPDFEADFGDYIEATYDPDGGLYDLYEDAGFEEALFGDC